MDIKFRQEAVENVVIQIANNALIIKVLVLYVIMDIKFRQEAAENYNVLAIAIH